MLSGKKNNRRQKSTLVTDSRVGAAHRRACLAASHFPSSSPCGKSSSGIDTLPARPSKQKDTCLPVTIQGVATSCPPEATKRDADLKCSNRRWKDWPGQSGDETEVHAKLTRTPRWPSPTLHGPPAFPRPVTRTPGFTQPWSSRVSESSVVHSDHKPIGVCPKGSKTPQS